MENSGVCWNVLNTCFFCFYSPFSRNENVLWRIRKFIKFISYHIYEIYMVLSYILQSFCSHRLGGNLIKQIFLWIHIVDTRFICGFWGNCCEWNFLWRKFGTTYQDKPTHCILYLWRYAFFSLVTKPLKMNDFISNEQ